MTKTKKSIVLGNLHPHRQHWHPDDHLSGLSEASVLWNQLAPILGRDPTNTQVGGGMSTVFIIIAIISAPWPWSGSWWFSLQLSFGGTLMVRTPIKVFICIDNSYAWCLRIFTRVPSFTLFEPPHLVFLKTLKRMSNIQPGNSFPLIWFPPWLCFSDYAIEDVGLNICKCSMMKSHSLELPQTVTLPCLSAEHSFVRKQAAACPMSMTVDCCQGYKLMEPQACVLSQSLFI